MAGDESGIVSEIEKRSEFINSSDSPAEVSELDCEMVSHFSGCKGLIVLEDRISRQALTKQGKSADTSVLEDIEMIGEVTPELLQTGGMARCRIQTIRCERPHPPSGGRPHPMIALIEMIRSIFLEMGFSKSRRFHPICRLEHGCPIHPTIASRKDYAGYILPSDPPQVDVDEHYLDMWRKVHEHGHDTGSKGWGLEFDKKESKKSLLRTHTTVNTVRHIAENPDEPSRVFGIGIPPRVDRQDTPPEFYQIEGIIHEPGPTCRC